MCINVGVVLGVVYSMFFSSYLYIHVGVMFAFIEFLLVSLLSLCIRDGVSFVSVYSLSMSIQDMCTRVGVMFSFVYSCWSQCLDLCGFILLYR